MGIGELLLEFQLLEVQNGLLAKGHKFGEDVVEGIVDARVPNTAGKADDAEEDQRRNEAAETSHEALLLGRRRRRRGRRSRLFTAGDLRGGGRNGGSLVGDILGHGRRCQRDLIKTDLLLDGLLGGCRGTFGALDLGGREDGGPRNNGVVGIVSLPSLLAP